MSFENDWKSQYPDKQGSAVDILRGVLANGSRIYIGSGAGEPQHLVRTLFELVPAFRDLEIVQNLSFGALPVDWDRLREHARLKTFFVGPSSRDAVNDGLADYIPIYFSAIPGLFRDEPSWSLDLALIQVSPPDEHGFCSLGVSVGTGKSAAESARKVVAQVNPRMPRTLGDSFLHISQISHFVHFEEPLLEVHFSERSAVAERIARYVSALVEDGSTVQVGLGRIPNSVLRYLVDKRDLGIHTEILTDSHLYLVQKGVVTGLQKTLHQGKIVASFCLGSRELYDFIDNNPEVELYPIEYVNNRKLISQHDRMVAINSALEIDLTGQICADSIGHNVYSGIGGYVDFMHGAASSDKGKAIIVLPSTSPDGRRSRIVSHLADGAGVVSSRSTIRYIVTEFGIAYLHGKTIRERALALINIAHPRFRERLLAEAKRLHYVYEDQILPPIYEPLYPGQWETSQIFPPSREIFFRPVKPTDERAMQEFFYSLPDQDIYYRFLSAMKVFPHRNTQAMCNIDYEHEMAIVGVMGEIGSESIIATGRYILDQKTNYAEVDFAVAAEWQHRGIGTFLLHYLCEMAKSKGITGFQAYVLSSNRRMLSIFHNVGYVVRSSLDEGIYEISFRFDEPAQVCTTENCT
ncbi:MAG: GNAT family N-acetyltransferase [Desulfobacteraceae bacterium]|nr:GNAT family N-acetyltransferase [Desulfobacteraceae bacterium]